MPRKTISLFRMPAEWERQQSTLMGWPYNKNDWPGKFNNIPKIFAKIISKITKSQTVNLLIKNHKSKNIIKKLLRKNNAKIRNVKFIICKTDRVWMRDTGPIFIKDKKNQNILICEIDFKKIESSRQHWPFFRDRRIDYYKGLLKNPRDA